MDFEFQKLLDTHWAWQKGIFVTEVKTVDGIDYYFGPINSEFFNLAEPKTPNINLQLIEDEFSKRESYQLLFNRKYSEKWYLGVFN